MIAVWLCIGALLVSATAVTFIIYRLGVLHARAVADILHAFGNMEDELCRSIGAAASATARSSDRNAPMRELRARYLSEIATEGTHALTFLRTMSDALGVGVAFEPLAASAKKRLQIDEAATKRLLETCIGVGVVETVPYMDDMAVRGVLYRINAVGQECICATVP